MKISEKTSVEFAAYVSPMIEATLIKPCTICDASGDSTHEGVEYDDDDPIFGNE